MSDENSIGTNSLRDAKKPDELVREIKGIALEMETETNDVMLTGIIRKNDKWDIKGVKVNKVLLSLYEIHNFHFIDNSNIKKSTHLNNRGLHLTNEGTNILRRNFVLAIGL